MKSNNSNWRYALAYLGMGLALGGLAGCGGGEDIYGDTMCIDFKYQEDAQSAYRNGATQLDLDGDGRACEHLPHR